jgi:hypothetical protein
MRVSSGDGEVGSGHTVEITNTLADFFTSIPVQQEHRHRGKQAPFKKTQKQSAHDQAGVVLNEAHAHAHETPGEDKDRDDTIELEALDKHGGRELVSVSQDCPTSIDSSHTSDRMYVR